MKKLMQNGSALALLVAMSGFADTAWGRQNIVIGEISIGYDYQERDYDSNEILTTQDLLGGAQLTPGRYTVNDREGDSRTLFATPRLRFSSKGATDLMEFTYAPTFSYDDVDSSNDVGHDLGLLAEKNITKDWLVGITNSYFYGEDSVADFQQQNSQITPAGNQQLNEPAVGAGPAETVGQQLTEENGRRQYWRNDVGLHTEYTYDLDSIVGTGYNYGVLRNMSDFSDGYTDYDRHEIFGRLSKRFNAQWSGDTELSYVKGIYDETQLNVIQADTVTTETLDDDLDEYHGRLRGDFAWRAHDIFFSQYEYAATDYEAELREDSAIHKLKLGWEHDFSTNLRMTLSAGPTFVDFDKSSDETGYNAYAGLLYNFIHSSLATNTAYDYEYDNFDGSRSGLSKVWRSELQYKYQFTPEIEAKLAGHYVKTDHQQPRMDSDTVVVVIEQSEPTQNSLIDTNDTFQYAEDQYDLGLSVSYNFLRWYTIAASYRYANFQSDDEADYDEHTILITLTAAKELFQW